MNELIKVNNKGDVQTTSARDLWEFLERPWGEFLKWFNQFKDYGFVENHDYMVFERLLENHSSLGGRPATDYEITIDMAKELAMLQKTEKGKRARQYFIELEKRWNSPEVLMARALKMADTKILTLESKIKELTPAAEFGNAVSNNQGGILVRDYVKVLENDGIRIGQDKLFSWLHFNGYIYRIKGYKPQWMAYKQYVEQGLFRVKETPVSGPQHGDWISYTIRITGKGQRFFYEKLKEERKAV